MKRILIDSQDFGTRIGIVENGRLEELVYERKNSMPIVGNVYIGKITNVLPGMQACFVDIGRERNAFLYYGDNRDDAGNIIKPKAGTDVLVQVDKGEQGKKGAVVTRKISFPGKFLVVIPNDGRIGVSKKISDTDERIRIKEIVTGLLPSNYGAIVRTDGEGMGDEIYKAEINRLLTISEDVLKKADYIKAPALLYSDVSGVEKAVRDFFHNDIDEVVTNSIQDYHTLLELCSELKIDANRIKLHDDGTQLFSSYFVEAQSKAAFNKQVWLKSGGFIVIEQTEACVVIDVNTGKFTGKADLQKTILKTNCEAAKEIAHQLRLRNLSGMIIVDFIDMKSEDDRQLLIKTLEEAVVGDSMQTIVVGMTELGLMQMTRKKKRQSIVQLMTKSCPVCGGTGRVSCINHEQN
ncbi:ribonuclease G [Clostridiales bacterium]|nr:ribonuclease G [Clostridiales bacterium]